MNVIQQIKLIGRIKFDVSRNWIFTNSVGLVRCKHCQNSIPRPGVGEARPCSKNHKTCFDGTYTYRETNEPYCLDFYSNDWEDGFLS